MTPSNKTITTVIPSFNRPDLIVRSINSVLNQTYPNVVAFICDNSTNNQTKDLIETWMKTEPRIRYHKHAENIGSYPNFNYGMEHVETDYFSFLSDDDILAPKFYEKALAALEQHPDTIMACMPTCVVYPDLTIKTQPITIAKTTYYPPGDAVEGLIAADIPATWTAILFRTKIREACGYLATDVGPQSDGGFVYYAAAKFPIVSVPGLGAVLLGHDASTSGTVPPMSPQYAIWWDRMFKRIVADDEVPADVREALAHPTHHDYKRIGKSQAYRALVRGEYKFALEVASGLNDFGYHATSRFLRIMTQLFRFLPVRGVLVLMNIIRKRIHKFQARKLQQKNRQLLTFLEQYKA